MFRIKKQYFYFLSLLVIVIASVSCENSKKSEEKSIESEDKIERILPQKPENTARENKLNAFPDSLRMQINMTSDNHLLINGKALEDSLLYQVLIDFIIKRHPTYVLIFQSKNKTSYSYYLKNQEIVKAVFNQVWNTESEIVFKKRFDDLTEEEKEKIKLEYPENILEIEPN